MDERFTVFETCTDHGCYDLVPDICSCSSDDTHAAAVQTEVPTVETTASEDEEIFFFFIMGGGLLIILFAVAASVSSVSSIAGILDEAAGEDKAV